MQIPLKTVSGLCACGNAFEYVVPKGVNDPKLCEPCVVAYQAKMDADRRRHNLRDFATACGIPDKFREWDEDIAEQIGNAPLLEWLRGLHLQSAWVGGTNGIGKTHAVNYRAYELLRDKSVLSYIVRSSAWLRDVVTMRTGRTAAEGDKMYRRAITTALLIMDDIGKERLSSARAELLYDIIDERDRNGLPIWFTTNFSGTDLVQRLNKAGGEDDGGHEYGHAIIKRLARMITPENIWKPK